MRKSLPYLRMAFSAACSIACLLVIVLWLRSNFKGLESGVTIDVPQHRLVSIGSYYGVFDVIITSVPDYEVKPGIRLGASAGSKARFSYWEIDRGTDDVGRECLAIRFPQLFVALLAAAFAAVPWLRWKFSLRTLLIATMLITVLLGIAVYFQRTTVAPMETNSEENPF